MNENFNNYGPNMFGIGLSVPAVDVKNVWDNLTETTLKQAGVDVNKPESVQNFINVRFDGGKRNSFS